MEKTQNTTSGHKLIMDARKEARITGVEKVISFEPDLVFLITEAGKMKITGKDMHMTNLDIEKGLLDLTGKVDCICYMTDKENGTFSYCKGCSNNDRDVGAAVNSLCSMRIIRGRDRIDHRLI